MFHGCTLYDALRQFFRQMPVPMFTQNGDSDCEKAVLEHSSHMQVGLQSLSVVPEGLAYLSRKITAILLKNNLQLISHSCITCLKQERS